jgi:flagellar biosynthesis GTPase FlhF
MKHFEESAGSRTPERDKQYMDERDKFASSPELDKYFASQEEREKANPEAFKRRGLDRSALVHKQVQPLDTSKEAAAAPAPTQETPAQQPVKQSAPAGKPKLSPEDRKAMMDKLPPELRAKFEGLFQDEDK